MQLISRLKLAGVTGGLTQQLGRTSGVSELAFLLAVTEDDIREVHRADLVFSTHSHDGPAVRPSRPATV